MPNHVYANITLHNPTEEQIEKLEQIDKVGICQYYKPRPKDQDENWYQWNIENWHTKWGDYDTELHDETIYDFVTAWSPINDEIIAMFANDFPNFEYTWEEEQGFGKYYEYQDHQVVKSKEWDLPEWEATDHDEITFLSQDHDTAFDFFEKGYYREHGLFEYLGETLEEAKQCIQ